MLEETEESALLSSKTSSLEEERLEEDVRLSPAGFSEVSSPPPLNSAFCKRIAPAARAAKTRTAAAMKIPH